MSAVSSYLCVLLRLLEQPKKDETFLSNINGLLSLSKLVKDGICAWQGTQPCFKTTGLHWRRANPSLWLIPSVDKLYTIQLLKKCIITKFQLVCTTREELAPVDLSQMCREIAEAADLFNAKSLPLLVKLYPNTFHQRLSLFRQTELYFSDFVGVLVSTRSEAVAGKLLCSCSAVEDVVSTAQQEARFIKSITSTFKAHSLLLNGIRSDGADNDLASGRSISPSDCGCEEEALKRVEMIVASELWKEVAVILRHSGPPHHHLKDLAVGAAQSLGRDEGLALAARCLHYVASTMTMDKSLVEWDKGFQHMLSSSQKLKSNKKYCKPVEILCSSVLPPLQDAMAAITTKPEQLQATTLTADHLDQLAFSHHLSAPLTISVHSISSTLLTSLELSLASCNLPVLARYIFAEGPKVCSSVGTAVAKIQEVTPATPFFPDDSRGCIKETRMATASSDLQRATIHMNNGLERVCVCFHDLLCERCKRCLSSAFPSAKQWKAIGKQSGTQAPTQPSKYCDVIVEQLIMPITEGALSLDGQSQIAYMTLTTSTLLNEYRKFILRNKHTQRSGRQLLVDFHYLCQWITSDKLGLLPSTIGALSSLPVMAEMERGLQTLSGATTTTTITPGPLDSPHCIDTGSRGEVCVRGLSSLPVWSEIACYNSQQWKDCITS